MSRHNRDRRRRKGPLAVYQAFPAAEVRRRAPPEVLELMDPRPCGGCGVELLVTREGFRRSAERLAGRGLSPVVLCPACLDAAAGNASPLVLKVAGDGGEMARRMGRHVAGMN